MQTIINHYLTFSDAMLAGAKLRPQAFGRTFKDGATCARSAAIEALTGRIDLDGSMQTAIMARLYPYMKTEVDCPAGDHSDQARYLIPHLNDYHRWTREQIAEWLRTIEEAHGYVLLTETEKSEVEQAELVTV